MAISRVCLCQKYKNIFGVFFIYFSVHFVRCLFSYKLASTSTPPPPHNFPSSSLLTSWLSTSMVLGFCLIQRSMKIDFYWLIRLYLLLIYTAFKANGKITWWKQIFRISAHKTQWYIVVMFTYYVSANYFLFYMLFHIFF